MAAGSNKYHGMTYQQAIDRLEKHKDWGWNMRTADAINMGIDALKEKKEKHEDTEKINKTREEDCI